MNATPSTFETGEKGATVAALAAMSVNEGWVVVAVLALVEAMTPKRVASEYFIVNNLRTIKSENAQPPRGL